MAKVGKSGSLVGAVGQFVYRNIRGTIVASAKPDKVTNPRSKSQMMNRTKLRNIINAYSKLKPALKDNFLKKSGTTNDYTAFMGANLSLPAVYLTKTEGEERAAVLAPFVVSFGTLQPLSNVVQDEWVVSGLYVGDLQLTSDTQVMDLSLAIFRNNEGWENGDILEVLACEQTQMAETYLPDIKCFSANVNLDINDDTLLSLVCPKIILSVKDGYLALKRAENGGGCFIHKRLSSKQMLSSIQSIALSNSVFEKYHSEEAKNKALESFDTKASAFLNPSK